jgi:hypothetical protein
MPDALTKKYPNAPFEWDWQYVFPASKPALDPRDQQLKLHHFLEDTLQRALKRAREKRGNPKKRLASHAAPFVRHPTFSSGLRYSHPARVVGHKDIRNTQVYLPTMIGWAWA